MLDHSSNSLFITNLNSISPYLSLSMHIDLMTSLHALNQGTVLKMLTEIDTLKQDVILNNNLNLNELLLNLVKLTF